MRKTTRSVVQGVALLLFCMLPAWAAPPVGGLQAEIDAFVQDMVERHGFDRKVLVKAFRASTFQAGIIRAMDAPATALPWHEFRLRHIQDARIENGLKFWAEHAALLERARAEYQVPPEIIVATLGIETLYGRRTGSISVLDALSTLAFGYPRRAGFFRGELEQFLLLARETGWKLNTVQGSFAGAIGIPQFLPGSYRSYAVDFDGDGVRDLRRVADTIGSVANYYRNFGWRNAEPVVAPVEIGEAPLEDLLAAGLMPHTTVAQFRQRGVIPLEPVMDDATAALFAVETETGPRYFLGFNNFYVITRYNRSINYAMVVHELATLLRVRRAQTAAGL